MKNKEIKCLVWDLDNTLWKGTMLENLDVVINDAACDVIKTLDGRGIIHSISSKNDATLAIKKLKDLGLFDYFVYPQIGWGTKSEAIERIAAKLNLLPSALAYVDDQQFEREEVRFSLPDVLCLTVEDIPLIADMPEFNPAIISDDAVNRRKMYQNNIKRTDEEERFEGPKHDFLVGLNMKMKIKPATKEDLNRVEELTIRTHQLNTTGYTYSMQELHELVDDPYYELSVMELEDRFGTYGTIGVVLLHCVQQTFCIKLLIMSCRIMSRGVGNAIIGYLADKAKKEQKQLTAEFRHTKANRIMYVTYRMSGFIDLHESETETMLQYDLTNKIQIPDYIDIQLEI